MGKVYQRIDGRLRNFIEQQAVFFAATAPLAGDGHVNLSPKGRSGSLTVLEADGSGVRAVIVVTAELISDTCGFAVPFLDYQGERTLHADYFGRKTDEQFAAYCAAKPHNAVSLDDLPALPLPLPALPAPKQPAHSS